ncbi:deoxyribose-phosphate aldolase [Manganibacter manganicus]|uniref:Deoxyribose-phosphate aldolase n=1 Tax=Manganibacter manganicus TaxID=1873176 RepID=A0A1V8RQC5_9HYPH|nr:deoxyribose-phosphate aldolase [Pseudaminobacter manganicus]OQM75368.1 deoxyribose-phosphate aldolase [Pseudaminobacter manganicus]
MFEQLPRNPGTALKLALVEDQRANLSAIERRAASLPARRSLKKEWQAAWLLRAIGLIDLTTLSGDDTPERVRRLCAKARNALREDLCIALGLSEPVHTGAVCVYPTMVATAVKALASTGIPVASVATGFPAGLMPLKLRLEEIRYCVGEGAAEIDIVVNRALIFAQDWPALYDEVRQMRDACGDAHMKTILATGDLKTLRNVARASMVCMMAGADFIKTSTGKEPVNATLPVGLVMTRAIRAYEEETGFMVGFKPAGGISSAKDALVWMAMMKEELGRRWLEPDLFRFGASSLLGDIERQIEHFVTGRYSAAMRHAVA